MTPSAGPAGGAADGVGPWPRGWGRGALGVLARGEPPPAAAAHHLTRRARRLRRRPARPPLLPVPHGRGTGGAAALARRPGPRWRELQAAAQRRRRHRFGCSRHSPSDWSGRRRPMGAGGRPRRPGRTRAVTREERVAVRPRGRRRGEERLRLLHRRRTVVARPVPRGPAQGRTHGVCQVGHGIPCGSAFYLINSALFTYKYLQQVLLVCLASSMVCLLVLNQEVTSSNLCSCNFRLHFLFPISLFSFFLPL